MKTEFNEFELEEFIKLWEDKVDMIGIQEFIKPTKVTQKIISNKTIKKKILSVRFLLNNL